jgi:hypothetical protein
MAARLAVQTRAAGSSSPQYAMSPMSIVGSQGGRWEGQFFSKKDLAATPFGHRRRVMARPARCGTITGATRA